MMQHTPFVQMVISYEFPFKTGVVDKTAYNTLQHDCAAGRSEGGNSLYRQSMTRRLELLNNAAGGRLANATDLVGINTVNLFLDDM